MTGPQPASGSVTRVFIDRKHRSTIKTLAAAVALTIVLAGYAAAREAVHRYHHHHPQHTLQPEPSPDAPNSSIYWSPAGGNPIHYAQTRGFYAGR